MRHLLRYTKLLSQSNDISDTTQLAGGNQNAKDGRYLSRLEDEDISLDTIDLTQVTPNKETTSATLVPISSVSSDDVPRQASQQHRSNSVGTSQSKKDDDVVITSKPDLDNSLPLSDEILFLSQNNGKDNAKKSFLMTDSKYPDLSHIDEDFQFFDDGSYNADLEFLLAHHNSDSNIDNAKDTDSVHTGQEKLENSNISHSATPGTEGNPCAVDCKAANQPSVADYSTPELKV